MVPPRDIYWLENPNTNRINSEKAPGLPVDENAAQNHIPGHDDEYHNCGDVAVSAIIHLGHPEITARDIVDLIHHRVDEGTLASELVKVINANYGDSFSAVKITPPVDTMSTLTNWLRRQILAGNILIPQVAIWSGNEVESYYNGYELNGTLRIGGSVGTIGHWVIITGMSTHWEDSTQYPSIHHSRDGSKWNWIRIFNPFDNHVEYYWWGDFLPAWLARGLYNTVLVDPIPDSFRMSSRGPELGGPDPIGRHRSY
jgi:hypothetical protein